jgi:hypothetical protein
VSSPSLTKNKIKKFKSEKNPIFALSLLAAFQEKKKIMKGAKRFAVSDSLPDSNDTAVSFFRKR